MDKLVLSTARLMVREMSPSDLMPLAAMLQDDGVMYAYGGAFCAAETEAWLDKQLRRYAELGFGLWAVCLNDTGEMIGQCGITMQEYNDLTVPEIGYLFARGHWHNGYAAEAAMACRCYGMANLHFNRLYSIIRITNVASQKVAFRICMRPEGTIVRHYRGQYMRHIVFSAGIDRCLFAWLHEPCFPCRAAFSGLFSHAGIHRPSSIARYIPKPLLPFHHMSCLP